MKSVHDSIKLRHPSSVHFIIMLLFGIGCCVLRQTWTGVAQKSAASIIMVRVHTALHLIYNLRINLHGNYVCKIQPVVAYHIKNDIRIAINNNKFY
jgi:hypothetical protein